MHKSLLTLFLLTATLLLSACGNPASKGDTQARLGYLAMNQRQFETARDHFETALSLGVQREPLSQVHTALGNALTELDRFEEAVEQHEKALEQEPRYHEAWVNLGVTYRLMGEFDQAESCYLKALEIQPEYPELHASLGALYLYKDDPEKALVHLKKSIELDDRIPVTWSNLAVVQAALGQHEQAENSFVKAVSLGYHNGPAVKKLLQEYRDADGAN